MKNVRLDGVTLNNNHTIQQIVRVVLYLRLSNEDRDKLTND